MIKKHIPNAITCANLLSGCVGIVYAFNGNLKTVAFFVILSGIFDFFDGFAARLLHVKSEIGKQLDSLADVVSFGFLPGVVLFKLLQISEFVYLPYLAFFITVFSAIRLAKFNIDIRQTEDFIGLNTPMNTFFVISLPYLIGDFAFLSNPWILISLVVLLSLLLVSEIRLFSMKLSNLSWKDNKFKFIFLIVSALSLIFFQIKAIPLILLFYFMLSFLHFRSNKYISKL